MGKGVKYMNMKIRAFINKHIPMYYFDLLNVPTEVQTRDSTFMLFIGIQDKNGFDLYVGDIIEFRANYSTKERNGWHKGVIVFNSSLGFAIKVDGFDDEFSIYNETDDFKHKSERLGNIYENPELME